MGRKTIVTYLFVLTNFLISDSVNAQWQPTSGTEGQNIISFASNRSFLFAGASGGSYDPSGSTFRGGAFRSSDQGRTWMPINTGLVGYSVYSPSANCLAVLDSLLFVGTDNGIFVSTDNGSHWREASQGLTCRYVRAFLVNGSQIFAGADSGKVIGHRSQLFLSKDYGATWTPVNSGITPLHNFMAFAQMGSILYAGMDNGGIYRSNDSGASWTQCPGLGVSGTCITIDGTKLYVGSYTGGGAYMSADSGNNWKLITNSLGYPFVTALFATDSSLILGTLFQGLFASTDHGETWVSANAGFSNPKSVRALLKVGANILAGIDTGVYIRPLAGFTTSVRRTGDECPLKYSIEPNYPNPFNGRTTFTFKIGLAGYSTITVYNALGQQVTTILSEYLPVGIFSKTWETRTETSGIYFIRFTSGSYSQMRKVLLLK